MEPRTHQLVGLDSVLVWTQNFIALPSAFGRVYEGGKFRVERVVLGSNEHTSRKGKRKITGPTHVCKYVDLYFGRTRPSDIQFRGRVRVDELEVISVGIHI